MNVQRPLRTLVGLPHLLAGYVHQPYVYEHARYLLAGTLFEAARRLLSWVVERFRFSSCRLRIASRLR